MCNIKSEFCPNCHFSDMLGKYNVITIGTSEPENLLLVFSVIIFMGGILNITNLVLVFFLLMASLPCLISFSRYPACERCNITWQYK